MTEVQIIEACRKGDIQAQKTLFDLYADAMFMTCIRYVPQQHDAEEILSDAFLKCFQALEKFTYRGEGSIRAWLSRIVINECLMFLRKKKKIIFIPGDALPETKDDSETIIDRLGAKELMTFIQKMPEGYRTVFNMYVLENFSHREIARYLGISENTSKTQLMKAKAFLRKQIEMYEKSF